VSIRLKKLSERCNMGFDANAMLNLEALSMMDLGKDIHSLTDFKRNTSQLVKQMEETGNPLVLTVNGRAKLVVQDAEAYQRLLDLIERAEAIAGIRRGLEDVKHGRTRPAAEAFEALRRRHNIPDES
jgi:prevent-host-death family protein